MDKKKCINRHFTLKVELFHQQILYKRGGNLVHNTNNKLLKSTVESIFGKYNC